MKRERPFFRKKILLFTIIPVLSIGIILCIIFIGCLTPPLFSLIESKAEAELRLASELGFEICENHMNYLIELRLENDAEMIMAMKNDAVEEIKNISKKFKTVHLMIVDNNLDILDSSTALDDNKLDRQMLVKNGLDITEQAWGDKRVLTHSFYFPLWRWHIVSFMYEIDFFAPVSRAKNIVYLGTFGVLSVVVITLFLMFNRMVAVPLQIILKATKGIAGGRLEKIKVRRKDEIGQVSIAFNAMVDSIDSILTELRESENKFRSFSEQSLVGIYLIQQGIFKYVNPKFADMFGYTVEQCLDNMHYSKTVHPDDLEKVKKHVREKLYGENQSVRYEFKGIKKCGKIIHVEIFGSSIIFNGKFATIGTMLDISERKQAEEAIESQNRLLNALFDNLQVGVFMVEAPSGKPLLTNKRAIDLLGRNLAKEADKNSFAKIYNAYKVGTNDFYPEDQMPIVRGLLGENHHIDDLEIVRPDGTRALLEIFGSTIKDKQDNVVASLVSFMDITERKRTAQELAQIFKMSIDMICIADINTATFIKVNPAFTETLGYSENELLSKPFLEFIHPQDREKTQSLIEFKLRNDIKVINFKNRYRCKDGSYRLLNWASHPIAEQGRTYAVAHDITEEKKMELQLQHSQKMESVGRLAGGVAHDFNNMLMVILGNTEIALDQLDPAMPLHDNLVEIRSAVQRSADLTRQLLAFARKQTIDPRILDLNATVSSMLKMLKRLMGENIELAWKPGSNLWRVKMDPSQIDQILANLSVNARDAINGVGKMTIGTKNVVCDKTFCATHDGLVPGNYVLLKVSDNGCGMTPEVLKNLFEPFFTTKEVGKGTGLGLATIYGIVKQNNGFIYVDSEPGKGTTFKIYFPAANLGAKTKSADFEKDIVPGKGTVLLVEDEVAILKLGKIILERYGYHVFASSTSKEALSVAKQHQGPIHLLISDVVMPDINGKDLRDKIVDFRPQIKTVFMSGYTPDMFARQELLDDGFCYLQKPFSAKTLIAKVREVLG